MDGRTETQSVCGAAANGETDETQGTDPAAKPDSQRNNAGHQSEVAGAQNGRGAGRCGELSEPPHLFTVA